MIREFTEDEKNILYREISLHHKEGQSNWGVLYFLVVNFTLWALELLFFVNKLDLPESGFLAEIFVLVLIILFIFQFFLVYIIFTLIRDWVVYSKYDRYAVEKIFNADKINIIQGENSLEFVIQIFDFQGGVIEIKTDVELNADTGYKKRLTSGELEKYKKHDCETVDMTIKEIIELKDKHYGYSYIQFHIKNLSTPAKFDFSETIYQYENLLKTQYELIYSLKTKELLFIGLKKGEKSDFESNIIINDVLNKVYQLWRRLILNKNSRNFRKFFKKYNE